MAAHAHTHDRDLGDPRVMDEVAIPDLAARLFQHVEAAGEVRRRPREGHVGRAGRMRDVLDDHVHIDPRIGQRREDRADRARAIRHGGQGDLGFVLVMRDAGDELAFHIVDFLFAHDQRAAMSVFVPCVVERAEHPHAHLFLHATVTVRDANGASLGTAVVATNGIYSVQLTTPQVGSQSLTVVQADAAGNVSAPVPLTAPDLTAPLAPTGAVIDAGATLSGTGEAGATVTVRAADGTVLGSAVVAADGSFAVPLSPVQANGEILQFTQTDPAGNVSANVTVIAPDVTAPTGLTAGISGDGAMVTGTGEEGAIVTVRDTNGATLGTAVVDANGIPYPRSRRSAPPAPPSPDPPGPVDHAASRRRASCRRSRHANHWRR